MAASVGNVEAPIIAIYVDASGRLWVPPEEDEVRIILAVWKDGRVIFSKDRLSGGRPYFSGKIRPERIDSFFKKLSKGKVFEDQLRNRSYFGPDSDYMVIGISRGRERVNMQSWDELFETNPNLVGTDHGILALEGRSREEVWAEQPEWYKRFREIWAEIRNAADALIPEEGEPAKAVNFEIRYLLEYGEPE
ncbi:MAG: hypothetical protein ACYS6W_12895 [Planctomycetota bacterium]|jgi:hypothetical protein